jgi:peptide/nickel transport system substrate-binding protein
MITRRDLIRSGAAAAAGALYAPSLRAQGMADTIRAAFAAGGPRKADPNQTTQGADNWATEQMFEQLVRPADGAAQRSTTAGTPQCIFYRCCVKWVSTPRATRRVGQ